jgi:hypothetical protein
MAITWPTKEQVRSTILTLWKAERPDADSTKYSDLWLYSRVMSVIVYRLHRTVAQALNAVFPTTTFEEYLDNWLSWLGLPDGQGGFGRILPHNSTATDGLTCSATGGGPGVAANAWKGKTLTDTAGNSYSCDEAHGAVAAGNSVDLDMSSVDTGFGVNLESGTTLTWDAPPAGSDSTAVTAKDLRGGTDLEDDSAGRARLLGRLRNPPSSGNVAAWVATIEGVLPGNLKAYVWPQRQNYPQGFNTTDYCALYTNETGVDRHIAAADDVYTDIDNAVDADQPALMYRQSRQLTVTSVLTKVELTVTLGGGASENQKCDWDAEGIKTTVSANDAGGPEVDCGANVCSPTITNGVDVGHKVVINGVEGTVTAINIGADASKFEVSDWPTGWGTALNSIAGYNVTSGGGFIGQRTDFDNDVTGSGLVEAVREYMDDRGPNVSYSGATDQIENWASSIKIQQLESACFVVGGGIIEVVSITDPAADLAHASESGATALIYDVGEITIWQVFV